jgi:hypothetical protein
MSLVVPVQSYILIGQVSQYLAGIDISKQQAFRGGAIDSRLPRLLYITRSSVQWAYSQNQNDSTLNATALYLYSLCGPYQNQASSIINSGIPSQLIIITQPMSQTVTVGANVTFTVAVTGGSSPYTYQWYDNGINILGATNSSYSISGVTLTNSGNYNCIVTDSLGNTVTSNQATLTVNSASVIGYASSQVSDPFPTLNGGSDPFVYGYTTTIVHNQPASYTLNNSDNNTYFIFKIPASENNKTTWYNTVLNQGTFPDSVFHALVTFGGYDYYISRVQFAFDATQPIILT